MTSPSSSSALGQHQQQPQKKRRRRINSTQTTSTNSAARGGTRWEDTGPQELQQRRVADRMAAQQRRRESVLKTTTKDNAVGSSQLFEDATTTVSVSLFSTARLPELHRLYSHTNDVNITKQTQTQQQNKTPILPLPTEQQWWSGGRKVSSRHLRRRITSFQPGSYNTHRRHRYPCPSRRDSPTYQGLSRKSRRKKHQSILTTTSTTNHPPHASSSSSSHTPPHVFSWLYEDAPETESELDEDVSHQYNDEKLQGTTTPPGRTPNTNSNKKWLVMHVWHAKRFHTLTTTTTTHTTTHNTTNEDAAQGTAFQGWTGIPLVHTNRGPQAAVRLSQDRCIPTVMIRDITYEIQPILFYYDHETSRNSMKQRNTNNTMNKKVNISRVLEQLGRILPTLKNNLSASSSCDLFWQGHISFEGTGYDCDHFPYQALGPVALRCVPLPIIPTARRTVAMLELRCHPALRAKVITAITTLMQCSRSQTGTRTSTSPPKFSWTPPISVPLPVLASSPKIGFRLYGTAATEILQRVLQPHEPEPDDDDNNQSSCWTWSQIRQRQKQPTGWVPNGTIVQLRTVAIHAPTCTTTSSLSSSLPQDQPQQPHHPHDVMLIYRTHPRLRTAAEEEDSSVADCAANRAMAGWEVYVCSRSSSITTSTTDDGDKAAAQHTVEFAKQLWLALVTYDHSYYDNQKEYNDYGAGVPPRLSVLMPQPEDGSSTTITTPNNNDNKTLPIIRGCCAIGVIEEYQMKLECEPPIPVFPRDYIDCDSTSSLYWNTTPTILTTKKQKKKKKNEDTDTLSCWKKIRLLSEGGNGRLPISKMKKQATSPSLKKLLPAIHFHSSSFSSSAIEGVGKSALSTTEEENNNTNHPVVVIVRGEFGQPFVDVVEGCCIRYHKSSDSDAAVVNNDNDNIPVRNTKQTKKHKHRRKVQSPTMIRQAPPLARTEKMALHTRCQQLYHSLSLPGASLLVHLRLVNQGTLEPGMQIVSAASASESELQGRERIILGRITAGCFSWSRGGYHGLGLLSAGKLLEYFTSHITTPVTTTPPSTIASYGRIVPLVNGTRSFQLLVHVQQNNNNDTNSTTEKKKQRQSGKAAAGDKQENNNSQDSAASVLYPRSRDRNTTSRHNNKYAEACLRILL